MSKEKNVSSFLKSASPKTLALLSRYDLLVQDHPLVGYLLGRASTILLFDSKSREIFISFCSICILLAPFRGKFKEINLDLLKTRAFWDLDITNKERTLKLLDHLELKWSEYENISKLVSGLLAGSADKIYMEFDISAKMFDQYNLSTEKALVFDDLQKCKVIDPKLPRDFISLLEEVNTAFSS